MVCGHYNYAEIRPLDWIPGLYDEVVAKICLECLEGLPADFEPLRFVSVRRPDLHIGSVFGRITYYWTEEGARYDGQR